MEISLEEEQKQISIIASALITPLGNGIEENISALSSSVSGIKQIDDTRFFTSKIPLSKLPDNFLYNSLGQYQYQTRFDTLLIQCAQQLIANSCVLLDSKDTIIILSTTKGNIELIETTPYHEALKLSYSAKKLQLLFENPNEPIIVSNACISGISAFIIAERLLRNGQFKHAVIIGVDVISKFVLNGFNSFHAIDKQVCKPFDLHRKGINMGEAAAGAILSVEHSSNLKVGQGFISNDANHISGPSKTGAELGYCISAALKATQLEVSDIDFICAHGTATLYNDEMESLAISNVGLHVAPVFSLKGAYGHTLGASGVLELVLSAACLERNLILPSINFEENGVSGDIQVNTKLLNKPIFNALKTGSGFGGCNAAIVLQKQA